MSKKEFTKTSLHNHFGGKKADLTRGSKKESLSFDLESAKNKIDDAYSSGYQLLGMTNHNFFWKDEYEQLVKYIENKRYNISLIPGVELDVVDLIGGQNKYLHVVLLISPKSDLDNFQKQIRDIIDQNKENAVTISQLTDLACLNKCILIPHGNKQKGNSARANVALFDDILSVRDFFPILIEDNTISQRNILLSKIKNHLSAEKFEWVTFSGSISALDQGDDFSTIKEPTYIWGESTFDSLFYCAIIGKERVLRENDIIEKNKYIERIEIINKGGVLQDAILNMSHGLNSIIGNSGSGKTLLLNKIKKELTGENLENAISASNADYDKMCLDAEVNLYDNNGELMDIDSINVFEGENLYKQIVASIKSDKKKLLEDLNATPSFEKTYQIIDIFNKNMDKYIENRIFMNKNIELINQSLIKFLASVDYLKSNKNLPNQVRYIVDPKLQTDYKQINYSLVKVAEEIEKTNGYFEFIKQALSKYGLQSEESTLFSLRFKLLKQILLYKNKLEVKKIELQSKIKISEKLSQIVLEYNNTIGHRAKVAFESSQIVSDEQENIINLLKGVYLKEKELFVPTLDKDELINSIIKNDDIIQLNNFKIVDFIDYDDFTFYFESAIGSGQGKLLKSKFEYFKKNPVSLFNHDSVQKFLEIFVENKYRNSNIFKLIPDSMIEFDIMLKNLEDEYQKIDTLSAGQLSKIYINLLIDNRLKPMENNAIILYDQPDNNLEKDFILNTLGQKISELKRKYQVIITTHEPLLVINSDSNNIIHAINDPIGGKNKITFENLGMYDVGDKEAAIEKIAKIIDGDKKAIRLRNQIYGGSSI